MTDPRSNSLTGADSADDAENDAYRAEVNGDEAVGGSTAVPSQNDTEELAEAVGIVIDDDTPLDTEEMLKKRDRERWELDPESEGDLLA
ncbi:MAG: hypothetical protein N5P05_002654 [Chroococcopsis gigantea SAG 12.99]|nr:hypothetical protein [Chlorogloea purpurea SAG 13.99]MDV3001048.1 hypothetical protein [Chroococcopsis gigantea SAG 12.99]